VVNIFESFKAQLKHSDNVYIIYVLKEISIF